jgi:hypothetical protein
MTMTDEPLTADDALTLDANAVAGMLHEVFGKEMTGHDSQCAHCGNRAPVGSFRVYGIGGPGVILRCSACTQIVIRLVRRPDGTFLVDASGARDLV